MNTAVITTAGARHLCGRLLGAPWGASANLHFGVFVNDYTPVVTSVLSDFDRNGVTSNDVTMTAALWQAPELIGDRWRSFWKTTATEFTTFMASRTVYGYVVWEPTGGQAIWAVRFDPAPSITPAVGVKVRPFFQFGPCG